MEDETRAFEVRVRGEAQALGRTLDDTAAAVTAYKEYTREEEMVSVSALRAADPATA